MHGLGVRPAAWAATYGATTCPSNSSVKLNTWWAMPSCCATRRASSTSPTEQHPESCTPPQSFMVTATTSCPSSANMAAATEESTPPDSAARTRTSAVGADRGAQSLHSARDNGDRPVDVFVGGSPAEREPERAARLVARYAHGGQHVRRLQRSAGA